MTQEVSRPFRWLVVDEVHAALPQGLMADGDVLDDQTKSTLEEIIAALPEADGLVVRSKFRLDGRMLGRATRLKVIARAGAGLDLIDVAEAEAKGVVVLHAAEGNADALGEHTVGLTLSLLNRFAKAKQQLDHFIWDREGNRSMELSAQTVGIIGYGNMGRAAVKRLMGFGCRILVYDKEKSGFAHPGIEEVEMGRIFSEADVLSLHVPLRPDTKGLVRAEYLTQFQKPIYLINTSRGEVAPTATVWAGLQAGKLLGAALDVLENEKLDRYAPDERALLEKLIQDPRVILTPHVAGWSYQSYQRISEVLLGKVRDWKASR